MEKMNGTNQLHGPHSPETALSLADKTSPLPHDSDHPLHLQRKLLRFEKTLTTTIDRDSSKRVVVVEDGFLGFHASSFSDLCSSRDLHLSVAASSLIFHNFSLSDSISAHSFGNCSFQFVGFNGEQASRSAPSTAQLWRMAGRSKMLNLTLGCCKVYVSESRNKAALETIERAGKLFPEVAMTNKFEDDAYNRVGYTLVSKLPPNPSADSCPLKGAAFSMIRAALEVIDFDKHCGSHPRLGIIDHVCFHPLADASMNQVVGIAKSLASEIGSSLSVPTFLYGAADEQGRKLDSIRRKLGYFKPNTQQNLWVGGLQTQTLPFEPDEGPRQVDQKKGIIVIGATDWVDNYNVPILTSDMTVARGIAKRVSGRGGGPASVQAMALAHGEGVIEVACNLLQPSEVGGETVQSEVERVAGEEGVSVGRGYFTDFSQDKVIQSYLESYL